MRSFRDTDTTSCRPFFTGPNLSPKSEPSPFSLKDRDRDRDSFRALWTRLKPVDKPDVGIPFDTDDAMFSPPIVPTRPPIEEVSSFWFVIYSALINSPALFFCFIVSEISCCD
jgi:hypothetical protein